MLPSTPAATIALGQLLDLLSVPAYVTDRLNRVCGVNHAYAELVGDPIGDNLDADDLFIITLMLGPYRSHFPRRHIEVAGCAPVLSQEIESGRLLPQAHALWLKALSMDDEAPRWVQNLSDDEAKWDGLLVFRQDNGRHLELQETVIPLTTFGLEETGASYLNLWTSPDREPSAASPLVCSLTSRQREIATLFALGHTAGEVAEMAGISVHTARDHRDNIYAKLGIGSRAELASAMLPEAHRT